VRSRTLFALGTAFVAACSLSTSFDGLSGGSGPNDGGLGDGSGNATGEGGAGTDGTAPHDAAFGPDAADAGPFCSGQSTAPFCADFEEGSADHVFEQGTQALATFDVDCSGCVAAIASGALSLTVPASADAGGNAAYVRFSEPVIVDTAVGGTLRFTMQVASFTPGQALDFASIHLLAPPSAPARVYVGVDATGRGELFVDRPGSSNAVYFGLPADGLWHRYTVVLANSSANGATSLTGSVAVDDGAAVTNDLGGAFAGNQATFYLGPSATPPVKGFSGLFDDVVFTKL
jgi:hypothetical protein